jgi:hypothetical protein
MLTVDELARGFDEDSLDPAAFSHREHVRVAWIYVQRYGLAEALTRFSTGIRAIATRAGKPERYHETVTWAYLLLINDRVARQRNERDGESGRDSETPSDDHRWEAFAAANSDLLTNGRRVLESWYRPETLDSPLARDTFVWPDRAIPGRQD